MFARFLVTGLQRLVFITLVFSSSHAVTVLAQQEETLEDILARVPSAPPGFSPKTLPNTPWQYKTGEGMTIEVTAIAQGLNHPWSMVVLPSGDIFVTERNSGDLRLIRDGVLDPQPVKGMPDVAAFSYSGLHSVVLHPNFEDNQQLFLSYVKPLDGEAVSTAILRGRWDSKQKAIVDSRDIFLVGEGSGSASSLMFDKEGYIWLSQYASGPEAQDLTVLQGKTLRLTDEGKPAPENPFIGKPNIPAEIYSYGHRTIQGFAQHPETGEVWSTEMGPNGGDEVNILIPAANYGWPDVSLGRDYAGPWQGEFHGENIERPTVFWMPSISVSGMTFYTGDKLPEWQGDLFVGGLRYGEIPGTGMLQRIKFNGLGEEIRRESLLTDLRHRIRGVFQDAEGYLYVLTDEDNGAVLRIEGLPEQ